MNILETLLDSAQGGSVQQAAKQFGLDGLLDSDGDGDVVDDLLSLGKKLF